MVPSPDVALRSSRERFADTARGRETRRRSEAKQASKAARKAARSDDVEAAEAAVRTYLSNRLNQPGGTLSPGEAASLLNLAGASGPLAQELERLLGWAEGARYGGASSEGLAEALGAWIARADKEWR